MLLSLELASEWVNKRVCGSGEHARNKQSGAGKWLNRTSEQASAQAKCPAVSKPYASISPNLHPKCNQHKKLSARVFKKDHKGEEREVEETNGSERHTNWPHLKVMALHSRSTRTVFLRIDWRNDDCSACFFWMNHIAFLSIHIECECV